MRLGMRCQVWSHLACPHWVRRSNVLDIEFHCPVTQGKASSVARSTAFQYLLMYFFGF